MWQRYTERARRVVFFAQEAALQNGESQVSTEHLLLGLLRETDSAAARLLTAMGFSVDTLRAHILGQVVPGEEKPLGVEMALAPRSRRVLDLAFDEARKMGNGFIGSEHILLGLLREGEGFAGRVLIAAGVDLEETRKAAYRLHADSAKADPDTEKAAAAPRPQKGDLGTLRREIKGAGVFVEIARDEQALAELTEAVAARDHHGYRDLLSAEKITLLAAGTEVKLLRLESQKSAGYFVRLLSGEREGQTGWVLRDAFRHGGPDTRPFPPPDVLTEEKE